MSETTNTPSSTQLLGSMLSTQVASEDPQPKSRGSMASSNSTGGVSVLGLLGVAFVVLKLCGVIQWNWIWVLSPFWIPLAVLLSVGAVAVGVAAVLVLFTGKK